MEQRDKYLKLTIIKGVFSNMDIEEDSSLNQQFIQQFIAKKKSSGKSLLTIKVYIDFLNRFFCECPKSVKDIRPEDVMEWLIRYGQNKKPRTIRQRLAILRTFFNYCVYKKIIDKSPILRRMKPRLNDTHLPNYLTDSEKAMIKRQSEDLTLRDRTIYESLQSSGMRRSELVGLNIQDVNLVSRCARVTGKGTKERVVKLSAEACYHIRKLIDCHPGGEALFLNRYNNRLSTKHIWRICNTLGKELNISQSIHPHLFRHTYATDEIAQGKKIIELKQLMGHEGLDTTMIYLHIPQKDLILAYDRGME